MSEIAEAAKALGGDKSAQFYELEKAKLELEKQRMEMEIKKAQMSIDAERDASAWSGVLNAKPARDRLRGSPAKPPQ